jgi:hypothetical protein
MEVTMKTFVYLIVSAGLVLVTACGSAVTTVELNSDNSLLSTPMSTDATNSSTVSPTSDQSSPIEPSTSNQSSPAEQKMIDLSRKNLSQKLTIDIDQIVVLSIMQITWRDAGLGCPKPGIDYIRVETPGYSIQLEAEGKTYNYHTDENKRVILCNT